MEAKRCRCGLAENKYSWKAYMAMICLQFGYAGMNLITKVSLDRDVSHFVLVVYRQAFATLLITPLALVFERKVRPTITFPIFMHMFVLGLLGPVMEQNLYYAGLKFTSPTFSCAITNLLPALTFLIALICRMEKVEKRWEAKVGGTILTAAGALLIMSLLHNGHSLLSVVLILGSTLSCASFLILQAVTLSKFPAPLTVTAVVCGLGTLQSTAFAFVMDPNPSVWNIGFSINLFAAAYAGIVSTGIAYYVQGAVVDMAGPVFVSAFNPLVTIIVAIMTSSSILAQKIYLAGIMGAVLMVIGVSSVLWGKHNDIMICKEECDDHDEIPEAIKVTNHICSLPTIFEDDDDVQASTCDNCKIETPTTLTIPDRAALTRIVIVPLEGNTLRPVIVVEAPIKLQSS